MNIKIKDKITEMADHEGNLPVDRSIINCLAATKPRDKITAFTHDTKAGRGLARELGC